MHATLAEFRLWLVASIVIGGFVALYAAVRREEIKTDRTATREAWRAGHDGLAPHPMGHAPRRRMLYRVPRERPLPAWIQRAADYLAEHERSDPRLTARKAKDGGGWNVEEF